MPEMKEYAAVFEKTSNGWSAYAPDLPGLGVAAAAFEEAELLLRYGIAMHIEGMREDGLPIPESRMQVMRLAAVMRAQFLRTTKRHLAYCTILPVNK